MTSPRTVRLTPLAEALMANDARARAVSDAATNLRNRARALEREARALRAISDEYIDLSRSLMGRGNRV